MRLWSILFSCFVQFCIYREDDATTRKKVLQVSKIMQIKSETLSFLSLFVLLFAMEEGASDKQQLDYGQNNYTPLILSTIALFLIAVFTVSRYGNLRTQPWYVSTVCIIGWCFPFWIVLLLPLDFSSVRSV